MLRTPVIEGGDYLIVDEYSHLWLDQLISTLQSFENDCDLKLIHSRHQDAQPLPCRSLIPNVILFTCIHTGLTNDDLEPILRCLIPNIASLNSFIKIILHLKLNLPIKILASRLCSLEAILHHKSIAHTFRIELHRIEFLVVDKLFVILSKVLLFLRRYQVLINFAQIVTREEPPHDAVVGADFLIQGVLSLLEFYELVISRLELIKKLILWLLVIQHGNDILQICLQSQIFPDIFHHDP